MKFSEFVLLSVFSGVVLSTQPADPVWPDTFQQNFNETFIYPLYGTHETTGVYYYDYANLRYRIDRANGRYDRYCGFNGLKFFQDTPCSHLVLNGIRWIIYPDENECCRCCDAEHGCGVLKPTWLKGAIFVGETNSTYKWNQKGLQDNFYTETKDRVMLQINQVPNDIQDFDPASFKTSIENSDEVFKLPTYCKDTACSLLSVCRAVGWK